MGPPLLIWSSGISVSTDAGPPHPASLSPGPASIVCTDAGPPQPASLSPGPSSTVCTDAGPPHPASLSPGPASIVRTETGPPQPASLSPGPLSIVRVDAGPPHSTSVLEPASACGWILLLTFLSIFPSICLQFGELQSRSAWLKVESMPGIASFKASCFCCACCFATPAFCSDACFNILSCRPLIHACLALSTEKFGKYSLFTSSHLFSPLSPMK
mmetsp:Transcript_22242/g.50167  ORF Transcript_22242/g.50167 Transcript_22242/m.50167 type:complete len:215 (+) Transcript_22242:49-693(+)